ncbi:hypothetical protein [Streptomyces sp. NPDC048187]|uniref:hypothetical protein n=1 Tax=Streptomyces sp. NPDC048187 TaxID=3365509 RepID=UPI00372064C3
MGDALDIMQIAGVGAAALVTEMTRSSWDSMRDAVARFFRRGGEERAEQELRLIDTARQRLVDNPESGRGPVEERLHRALAIQLEAFLQAYPDAAEELQVLTDRIQGTNEGDSGGRTTVHHNSDSQIVIAGGAINASGGFHYRAPEGGR